jgi:CRISPR/Cas system-associated exonuclease Cas4 (RecB family)
VKQWADRQFDWDHVELDVSTTLPSGIKIKAYVDRVEVHDGFYDNHSTAVDYACIRDLKTGSSRPDSDQQLGIYKVLTELKLGLPVLEASNYMFKDDEFYEMDVSNWTLETVDELAKEWYDGLRAGVFLPNRGKLCGTCGVSNACFLQSGDTATTRSYDRLNPNYGR